jgi:pyruvate dehydrogenase E1 component
VSYDPAYAYELAVILDEGMRRMMERGDDVFYYITVTNENEAQPSLPEGVQDGILRGMYCLGRKPGAQARLLGSGPILKEAVAAAALPQQHWQIEAEVWSVTSYTELARDGVAAQRAQRCRARTRCRM